MKIQIPQPCHEKWDEMNPTKKGAFCLACQKEVVDFSTMSDEDIKQHFQKSAGKTCGRFRQDQIDRPLAFEPQKGFSFAKIWLSLGLFLGVASQGYAQKEEKKEVESTFRHITGDTIYVATPLMPIPPPPPMLGRVSVGNDTNVVVQGKVVDAQTDKELPDVSITIGNTNRGNVSDVKGNFTVNLRPSDTKLTIQYTGYKTQEITINPKNNYPLVIKLKDSNQFTGEVVVGTKPTLWQRIKNIFRRKN